MSYDKNATYVIAFVGGPYDRKSYPLTPADRVVWDEFTPNGAFLKKHVWNLRETVNREDGKVVQLEYVYQS